MQGRIVKYADFIAIKTAIHSEISRRNLTPVTDDYLVNPDMGVLIYKEHLQNIFLNNDVIDNPYPVPKETIVKTSDVEDTINYVKSLMLENLRK